MCEPIEDLPKNIFIKEVASYYQLIGCDEKSAISMAIAEYEDFSNQYSKEQLADFDWCKEAAREFAEENMSYWE